MDRCLDLPSPPIFFSSYFDTLARSASRPQPWLSRSQTETGQKPRTISRHSQRRQQPWPRWRRHSILSRPSLLLAFTSAAEATRGLTCSGSGSSRLLHVCLGLLARSIPCRELKSLVHIERNAVRSPQQFPPSRQDVHGLRPGRSTCRRVEVINLPVWRLHCLRIRAEDSCSRQVSSPAAVNGCTWV